MKKIIITSLAASILALTTFSQTKISGEYPIVTGKVTSVTGESIPGLTITFESELHVFKTQTGIKGEYLRSLPPGVYKMRVDEWIGKLTYNKEEQFFPESCSSYFRPFYRSDFEIKEGTNSQINIVLIESGCVDWSEKGWNGAFLVSDHFGSLPRTQYETIPYEKGTAPYLNIVVQYGDKQEKEDSIVYKFDVSQKFNLMWGAPHPGVMLTYGFTTIYANELKYIRAKKIVTASGNIVVDDGKSTSRFKEAVIRLGKIPKFEYK